MEFKYVVPISVEIDLENFIQASGLSIHNIDKNFNKAFSNYMATYDDVEYYTCDCIKDKVREEVLAILQKRKNFKKTYQIKFCDEYINVPCHGATDVRKETACWLAINQFSKAYSNAWQNMWYCPPDEDDKFRYYVNTLLDFGYIDGVVEIIEKEYPIYHLH